MLTARARRALMIPPVPTWTPDDLVTCQRCGAEMRAGGTVYRSGGCIAKRRETQCPATQRRGGRGR